MTDIVVFGMLCTSLYYLLARAEITSWLWRPLDGVTFIGPMLRCPACCGTWIGALLSWYWTPLPISSPVECTIVSALLGMVCTAVIWGVMKWALDIGSVDG